MDPISYLDETNTFEISRPFIRFTRYHRQIQFLINVITETISNCTPSSKTANIGQHRNPVPWWNDECTKLIRLRKAALKKWRYSRNVADYIEYKKRVASAKKYIKKCKVDSFRKFAQSINFETDMTSVCKKCRILKNKWASVIFNEGYSDRLNKIEDAINKLTPPWVSTKSSFASQKLYANENNQFFNSPFGLHKFTLALNSSSLKVFPGPDTIEYILIVKLSFSTKLILLDLLNEIYSLSIYPPA